MLMTAYGSIATAVDAIKRGVYDFVTKPINLDELSIKITRAIQSRRLVEENAQLRQQVDDHYGLENLIGESLAMQRVYDTISQDAPSRAKVLITHERGTGKELVQHPIHYLTK